MIVNLLSLLFPPIMMHSKLKNIINEKSFIKKIITFDTFQKVMIKSK